MYFHSGQDSGCCTQPASPPPLNNSPDQLSIFSSLSSDEIKQENVIEDAKIEEQKIPGLGLDKPSTKLAKKRKKKRKVTEWSRERKTSLSSNIAECAKNETSTNGNTLHDIKDSEENDIDEIQLTDELAGCLMNPLAFEDLNIQEGVKTKVECDF